MPALENFGFEVIENVSSALDAGQLGGIDDFLLVPPAGRPVGDFITSAAAIETAIAAVLNGAAENDVFNRLILANGLADREVNWLRGWYRYLRQAGMGFGIPTVVDALQNAPQVTRGILDLFIARHDPSFAKDRVGAETAAQAAIIEGLGQVAAINDDRLLRQYKALVDAMLRTNAFVASGEPPWPLSSIPHWFPACPGPCPGARFSCFRRRSRAFTCAPDQSRAGGCAGPTGATISAPKCSG